MPASDRLMSPDPGAYWYRWGIAGVPTPIRSALTASGRQPPSTTCAGSCWRRTSRSRRSSRCWPGPCTRRGCRSRSPWCRPRPATRGRSQRHRRRHCMPCASHRGIRGAGRERACGSGRGRDHSSGSDRPAAGALGGGVVRGGLGGRGALTAMGTDYRTYMDATRVWLPGGSFYPAYELAGPYQIELGAVLYPPVALLLFVPFTVLPAPAPADVVRLVPRAVECARPSREPALLGRRSTTTGDPARGVARATRWPRPVVRMRVPTPSP